MAEPESASGLAGRHRFYLSPPRDLGRDAAGVGRRRWWPYRHLQQQREQPPPPPPQHQGQSSRRHASWAPHSSLWPPPPPPPPPPASSTTTARAAPPFCSGETGPRRAGAQMLWTQEAPPTWRRGRRPSMELPPAPEPGWWWKVRGRLLLLLRRRLQSCAASSLPSLPRRQRRVLAAAGLTCCALLALCAVSSSSSSSLSLRDLLPVGRPEEEEEEEEAPEAVVVLLWWEPFGRSRRLGDCRGRFNVSACHLTTNRSRLLEAQAVLFHHRDLGLEGLAQLPQAAPRPPAQRWVWMNFESPSHSPGLRDLAGIFNWTMSYRVDSDVFVPYGYLRPNRAPVSHLALPKKTKLLAWVISNWNEDHARVRYYHQLRNYLPIDVYGSHGLELKGGSVVETVSEYKFYLAFENSQHQDYITEKLWRNAFKSWAVPIVLGPPRSNYELFVPSDSFIHIDDFSGPKQLARYLKFLDKNKKHYKRYFAWRKHYNVSVTSFWDEHCCRVCDVVRTAGEQPKTIQNLANWFER